MKEPNHFDPTSNPEINQKLIAHTFSTIPHTNALGVEFVTLEKNKAIGRLPYKKNLIGNIENGALHTGVLISLFDTIAGLAVFGALPEVEAFATLDLRLDNFKPSIPKRDIFAQAECHNITKTIAYVKGSIYHDNPDDPIAGCVATFFRTGQRVEIQKHRDQWP
jgi:uncharacterized protein (TIGR00369 family)